MTTDMSIERQRELLAVWPKKVSVSQISIRMLLLLFLKIIVGLYLIVYVGSIIRSFLL